VVSALFLVVSFPPLHPLLPPFVALVPLSLFVQGLAPDPAGRRAAVRGSLLFGLVLYGILFYWIVASLLWFSWLAVPAYLGVVGLLAGAAALFGWILHRTIHGGGAPLWVALPVAWTAVEWFRAHWPGPFAFPWLGLGTSLTGFPELVGIAELVGERGVTLWIALVNGLIATLIVRRLERRAVHGLSVAAMVVLLLPPAWGVWRSRSLNLRLVGPVAVVQPNVPEHLKLDPRSATDSTLSSLDRLVPRIDPGSVSLVVLPEATLPVFVQADFSVGSVARMQDYAREAGAPILFGGLGHAGELGGEHVPFNSAFLMEPQGLADFRYDKRHLVPMVERVPLLTATWLGDPRRFGGFGVGRGWPVARAGGAGFGVLVCYESTYPQSARRFRLEGADVLVNITNDAWFGREPWYTRTTALWQHPAHLVMRAIENRVGVVRAANTGISFYVDPLGRIYNATRLFEPDVRQDVVFTSDVLTLFTRMGDLAGVGCAAVALLLTLVSVLRERRVRSLDPVAGRD
jgi:apolipoprotein N-acyltransferase